MLHKILKYGIPFAVALLVLINSVYFRKLSDMDSDNANAAFNAAAYADEYWNDELIPAAENAVDYAELLELLRQAPDRAFEEKSHALGIGNIRYFMVKGIGKVSRINENNVVVQVDVLNNPKDLVLETEFIYGNAVRDAAGAIDLNDFPNTTHLNSVSAEINKQIREKVIPPFLNSVEENHIVEFAGAIELNRKYLDLMNIELIPVFIHIKQ